MKMDIKKLQENLEIDKVYCLVCNKRHFPDEETFLTFYGNVMVGLNEGVIGNNLDEIGKVVRCQYVCRHTECINKLFELNITTS